MRAISELSIVPIQIVDDPNNVRATLIDRGRRYHTTMCEEHSYRYYKGKVERRPTNEASSRV